MDRVGEVRIQEQIAYLPQSKSVQATAENDAEALRPNLHKIRFETAGEREVFNKFTGSIQTHM
jgi:hypothetical protein